MHKHSLFCRAAALVLTLALTAALALPGFAAAYAMPIQTSYDAEAVYLFDASTGEALVEQNPDQVRPIASLTKMMTALLVLESGADLNESIPIPDSLTPEFQAIRANRGHTIGLQAGESVRRLDMLYAILMMVRQVNDGRHEVENEFTRAVTRDGNVAAIRLRDEVFELRDSFEWRGLGRLPKSALKLRPEWADFDAEKRFAMTERAVTDNKACACGAILRGEKTPEQCPLFGRACNPANPIGACMVSSEGACAAAWSYGRRRAAAPEKAKTSDDQR